MSDSITSKHAFNHQDIELSRHTMADMMVKLVALFKPLHDLQRQHLGKSLVFKVLECPDLIDKPPLSENFYFLGVL